MAGRAVHAVEVEQRILLAADHLGARAARVEAAAGRQVDRARRIADDGVALRGMAGLEPRHGSRQRASTPERGTSSCTRSSSLSAWRTVMRGLSEEYGSWKIIWTRRRSAAVRLLGRTWPSTRTSPAVGS